MKCPVHGEVSFEQMKCPDPKSDIRDRVCVIEVDGKECGEACFVHCERHGCDRRAYLAIYCSDECAALDRNPATDESGPLSAGVRGVLEDLTGMLHETLSQEQLVRRQRGSTLRATLVDAEKIVSDLRDARLSVTLECSTGHLSQREFGSIDRGPLRSVSHEYGVMVFLASGVPRFCWQGCLALRRVSIYARSRGCSSINFDRDGARHPELEYFSW